MNVLKAAIQLLDFIWKAAQAYAATPEGQKELNDIGVALELEGTQPTKPFVTPNKRV